MKKKEESQSMGNIEQQKTMITPPPAITNKNM